MSVVPIGFASDTTPLYEENYPVISAGNVLTGLQDTPMPPGTTLDYTLIPAREYDGDPAALVDYLIDIQIEITIVTPLAEDDNSIFTLILGGDVDTPNFDRDLSISGNTPTPAAQNSVARLQACGIVRIQKNQSVDCRIARVGGNPNATWTFNGAWRKFKRLE